jgi:hypothetical protein
MLPEVQEYFDTIDRLETELRDATEKVGDDLYYSDRTEYYKQVDAARNANLSGQQAAWDKLKESNDPLVKWIAENAEEYHAQARVVLRALPATLHELDAIARDHDWCYVWGQFRDRAIADGAVDYTWEIQIKVNGGPWQEFWPHSLPSGRRYVNKDSLLEFFKHGASMIQITAGSDHIIYQLKEGPLYN